MDGLLPDIPEWWLLVLALAALVVTATLVAAESALRRIGRTALTELQDAERPRAAAVERLADDRERALPGLVLARVLAEMTTAVSLTLVVADLLPEWWQVLVVAVLVAAVLIAAVAGTTPRRVGTREPGRVLHALLPFVNVVLALTRPATALAAALTPKPRLTEAEAREEAVEDLRDMVDRVSQSEQLADDERTMLQSMFDSGHDARAARAAGPVRRSPGDPVPQDLPGGAPGGGREHCAEAIVSGRPVVVGSTGGQGEYIDERVGTTVDVQTAEAYADAVERVLARAEGLSAHVIAATVGDRFEAEQVAAGYQAAYDRAVAVRARRR